MAKLICEVCQKESCNCGSLEKDVKLRDKDVKKFARRLQEKLQEKPIDMTKTVSNATTGTH